MVLLAETTAIWQVFLLQGVMYGMSISCWFIVVGTWPPSGSLRLADDLSVAIIPNWFLRRRAAALGVSVAGGSFGGVRGTACDLGWADRVDRLSGRFSFAKSFSALASPT
jgi:hypothetical protein